MLTYLADEVIRDFFSNIFVSADSAVPDLLDIWCCAYLLRFWFDVVLVVFVGAGWVICKDCHEGGLANEQSMGGWIYRSLH